MLDVPAVPAITTARLTLVSLAAEDLTAMLDGARKGRPYTWPAWWPDETDRGHVDLWRERARTLSGGAEWGPRAVVDPTRRAMIGHVGFHLPPRPLTDALSDPTFANLSVDSVATLAAGSAVEIGYTIFPAGRRRGYASEVVDALVGWAFATGEVSTVLASVAQTNAASHGVLRRVGGFRIIGTCRDDDGTVELVYRRDRN